jgi:Arc/MetJ-type ribon-helix-helix transcriptional regulator
MGTRWPRDIQTFVDEMLANGSYGDEGEMILHAMHLLRDAELNRRRKHEELRQELLIGVEQLERGESAPLDMKKIMERVRKHLGVEQETIHSAGDPQ